MSRCCLLSLLLLALALLWVRPEPAPGAELFGWLRGQPCSHAPAYSGNPKQIVTPPPGPHRYPEYNVCCPWYGYGFGVPTYQWGYFGAQYRPACVCHTGYYGDFTQWSYRIGY